MDTFFKLLHELSNELNKVGYLTQVDGNVVKVTSRINVQVHFFEPWWHGLQKNVTRCTNIMRNRHFGKDDRDNINFVVLRSMDKSEDPKRFDDEKWHAFVLVK